VYGSNTKISENVISSSLLIGMPEGLQVDLGMCKHKHLGSLPRVRVLIAVLRCEHPSHCTSFTSSWSTKRESKHSKLYCCGTNNELSGGKGNDNVSSLS